MLSTRPFLFGLIVFLLSATAATAQPKPDQTTEARERFRKGTQLYDMGKYVEAATEYEMAFQLSDRPGFLFNIGQAYRAAGKPFEAVAAYRGFVRRVPDSPQRPEAERLITVLEAQLQLERERTDEYAKRNAAAAAVEAERLAAEQKVVNAAANPSLVAPPPTKTPFYKKWWLWTVVGVVIVGGAVGAGVGVALSKQPRGSLYDGVSLQ